MDKHGGNGTARAAALAFATLVVGAAFVASAYTDDAWLTTLLGALLLPLALASTDAMLALCRPGRTAR